MHENRETSSMFPGGDRSGKAERRRPDVYVGEESDRVAVPMKPPNKEAQASAEGVERVAQRCAQFALLCGSFIMDAHVATSAPGSIGPVVFRYLSRLIREGESLPI